MILVRETTQRTNVRYFGSLRGVIISSTGPSYGSPLLYHLSGRYSYQVSLMFFKNIKDNLDDHTISKSDGVRCTH